MQLSIPKIEILIIPTKKACKSSIIFAADYVQNFTEHTFFISPGMGALFFDEWPEIAVHYWF